MGDIKVVRAVIQYRELPEFVLVDEIPPSVHRQILSIMGEHALDIHDDAIAFPYNKAPGVMQFLQTMGVNVKVTKRAHAEADGEDEAEAGLPALLLPLLMQTWTPSALPNQPAKAPVQQVNKSQPSWFANPHEGLKLGTIGGVGVDHSANVSITMSEDEATRLAQKDLAKQWANIVIVALEQAQPGSAAKYKDKIQKSMGEMNLGGHVDEYDRRDASGKTNHMHPKTVYVRMVTDVTHQANRLEQNLKKLGVPADLGAKAANIINDTVMSKGAGVKGHAVTATNKSFMAAYEAATTENPFSGSHRVWNAQDPSNIVQTEISEWDGNIHINTIISPAKNKGNATKVMEQIVKLADQHGVQMALEAVPFGRQKGALTTKQLHDWYAKFGFVDHEYSTEDEPIMFRPPKNASGPKKTKKMKIGGGGGLSFDDFEWENDNTGKPTVEDPRDRASKVLKKLDVGQTFKVGPKSFDVWRHEPGSVTVLLTMTGTKGKKLYTVMPVDLDKETFGVWAIDATGGRVGEPIVVGPIKMATTAFNVMQRRSLDRQRGERDLQTVLENADQGHLGDQNAERIKQRTGLDPKKAKDRTELKKTIEVSPPPTATSELELALDKKLGWW